MKIYLFSRAETYGGKRQSGRVEICSFVLGVYVMIVANVCPDFSGSCGGKKSLLSSR